MRITNERGHASAFARENRQDLEINERLVAEDWCNSMQLEYGVEIFDLIMNEYDPPDCYAVVDGRKNSIELAELVNGEILASVARAKKQGLTITSNHGELFQNSIYTEEKFLNELNTLIEKKNARYKKNDIEIDVLVIHTDERWLTQGNVQDWLKSAKIQTGSAIKSAYLLMEETAGPSTHCPIFRLFETY